MKGNLLPQTIETKRKPNNLWVFARENKVVFANRMRKKHHFSCLFILPLFESFRDIATDWTIVSYLTFRRSTTRQKTNRSRTMKLYVRGIITSRTVRSGTLMLLLSGWLRDLFKRVSRILFFFLFTNTFPGLRFCFSKSPFVWLPLKAL